MERLAKQKKQLELLKISLTGICTLFTLSACDPNMNLSSGDIAETEAITAEPYEPATTPIESDTEVNTPALKVVLRQTNYFSSEGKKTLENARELLQKVVNTDEFKERILAYKFTNKNGYTNLQIYNLIMGGGEKYPSATTVNKTMDLYTEYYTSSWYGRNVVGYTTPDTSTIYMNSYFFDYAESSGIAANMMHEWLHKLGFDHSSASDYDSIPYAVGYIAEEIALRI